MKLYVKKLHKDAILPQIANKTDCAYDLFANESGSIRQNDQRLVGTGIAMAIPNDCVGIIKSRSGLSVKEMINVGAGVIDSGYRGEIKALIQTTSRSFHFEKGQRIAQLLIIPMERPEIVEAKHLDITDRGENGFGSTGKTKLDLDSADQAI